MTRVSKGFFMKGCHHFHTSHGLPLNLPACPDLSGNLCSLHDYGCELAHAHDTAQGTARELGSWNRTVSGIRLPPAHHSVLVQVSLPEFVQHFWLTVLHWLHLTALGARDQILKYFYRNFRGNGLRVSLYCFYWSCRLISSLQVMPEKLKEDRCTRLVWHSWITSKNESFIFWFFYRRNLRILVVVCGS